MPRLKERDIRPIERRKEGTLNKKGSKKGRTKEALSYSRERGL
jgi:hypothetical protein